MAPQILNITTQSIIGTPTIVQFDSHYQNEPLYTFVGIIIQTRDGKENPPRLATYYVFEEDKHPLCYGFCAVLFNWALKEARNRFVISHPNQKVILSTPDLNFDFEEFIPVDELCEQYLKWISLPYKSWLQCSPRLKQFTESNDALFSFMLFAEYDYFCDFFYRGISEDLSEKQKNDFLTWWHCLVDYITKHYKIDIPVRYIQKRVVEFLSGIGALTIPKEMTLEDFCESASTINVDRTINNKSNQQIYQINIMPTHVYQGNAIHNDNSKTINVRLSKEETLDLIRGFLKDEEPIHQRPTTQPKQRKGKKVAEVKPYTIDYICVKDQKPLRLQLLRCKWVEWGWIKEVEKVEDFDDFFEGKIRDCNLIWTGANEAILYELLQTILKQTFVKKHENCSARSICIGQFKKENIRSDKSRVSEEEKMRIDLSIYLLDTTKPIPQPRSIAEKQPDISDSALYELLIGQLHVTKDLNKKV